MRNIHDWCVSRQLWWGHRIPAWFCDGTGTTPSRARAHAERARAAAGQRSSRTRTCSTPGSAPGSGRSPPSAGRKDGGARQVLSDRRHGDRLRHPLLLGRADDDDGHPLHGRGAVPRRLSARMVRDKKGKKMSKTGGNVIDPLDITAKHGADALRFTLAAMAAQGRDIKLAVDESSRARPSPTSSGTRPASSCRYADVLDANDLPGPADRLHIARSSAPLALRRGHQPGASRSSASATPRSASIASSGASCATGRSS